jgi:hypothetical protein
MRHCRSRPEIKDFTKEARSKRWIMKAETTPEFNIIANMTNTEFRIAYWKYTLMELDTSHSVWTTQTITQFPE